MNFGDFIAAMEYRATNLDEYMGEHGIELTPRNKGRILLASRLGLMDPLWLPGKLIKGNGRPGAGIDSAPEGRVKRRPADPDGYGHHCPEIPSYDGIRANIDALTRKADNDHLRAGSLGLVGVKSKAPAILSERIRGVSRMLWLFHLWNGDNVQQIRSRYYHPSDVKRYWPLAWEMHGDGTRHADALAYLRALCAEWAARTGKEHAGLRYWQALQNLLEEAAA